MTHHINFERTTVLLFFNLDGNAMKIRPLVAMGSYRTCSGSAQGSVILHNRIVKFWFCVGHTKVIMWLESSFQDSQTLTVRGGQCVWRLV